MIESPKLVPSLASGAQGRPATTVSVDVIAQRYEVEEELARGGMGVVYRVRDRTSGKQCALKRILNRNDGSEDAARRAFEQEYRVLANLDHPRIIRVFSYGVDERGPYYTMELLTGDDFAGYSVPWRALCLYLRDLATSLSLLHARRLLHRDLSPKNVKRTDDGHCKLLDFGALTAFGYPQSIVGNPPAIPPEALAGGLLDQRADLYALGAFAYWALCGRHAYPARTLEDLPRVWKSPLPPPSAYVSDIPAELDLLVTSLLSANPLARPSSAADVITQLNAIGELPLEDERETRRLALSFLHAPRFIGRANELAELERRVQTLARGRGAALRIEAVAGHGRTRLLEELGLRAQIAGATVLRVDASVHPSQHGTSRALAAQLCEALPELARARAHARGLPFVAWLRQTGPSEHARREGVRAPTFDLVNALDEWLSEVSRERPLAIEVDNVEYADDASLALLIALARRSAERALLLIVTERVRSGVPSALGLASLRNYCDPIVLSGLSAAEALELARSLFGDAPNVERFAEWLFDQTAGSPLHFIEISQQLVARAVIRYESGMWALPAVRPATQLPEALEDALSTRTAALSEDARALAECLSLQREQPTLELCRLLVEARADARERNLAEASAGAPERNDVNDASETRVAALLEELSRNDVLLRDVAGYRFSSLALREALLARMEPLDRERNHRRLGDALLRLAGPHDHARRIEAGFQLIRGGAPTRGADCIAEVMSDTVAVRKLLLNLYRAGAPAEAALKVYKRERRSSYERVPLLAVLAQAGNYEDFAWADKYGDEALDALEDLSGMRLARRARPWCGRYLALLIGLLFAFTRFHLTPKRERRYSFRELMIQLFTGVSTLTGTAAMQLDPERAERVAAILEPFSVLPERLTPRGIYQFCVGMQQIGRERQAEAFERFDMLARRFADQRYYPTLPADARVTYRSACNFARGSFAIFRSDSQTVFESAAVLDASGHKLYAMIASQLRFLYHANRGELVEAKHHRDQVELHAAQVGSAWQVELWEGAALIPLYLALDDSVALRRVEHRLDELSGAVPSLELYRRLAQSAGLWRASVAEAIELGERTLAGRAPRSFIGWSAAVGFIARGYNQLEDYARAKATCERALALRSEADLQYVSLFLELELQMAFALAGLGEVARALERLEALLRRYASVEHPLVLGLLHEASALIALRAGRLADYQRSLAQVEHWFGMTGTPALISKCERLAALGKQPAGSHRPPSLAPLPDTIGQTLESERT